MQTSDAQFIILDKIKYPLVNQFYKRVYKKGIARKNETVFVLQQSNIICSAKIAPCNEHLLLTAVACDPDYRGQGYAKQLLKQVLALQTQAVYCFSYTYLSEFYIQLGFTVTDIHSVPAFVSEKFRTYNKNNTLQLLVKNS